MDDFFLVGVNDTSSISSCSHLVEVLEKVCRKFGIPLAPDKSVGPTTKIVFLGLEIDSDRFTVSIPQPKIEKIIEKTENALNSTRLMLRDLQSLIGSLSFVCKAVSPGERF